MCGQVGFFWVVYDVFEDVLNDSHSVPWTVAITNTDDDDALFSEVETKIRVPENRDLIPCDVSQKDDIKNVILSLK